MVIFHPYRLLYADPEHSMEGSIVLFSGKFKLDTGLHNLVQSKTMNGSVNCNFLVDIRDWSIFIRGLGPVQKVIGHILFFVKIIIEL